MAARGIAAAGLLAIPVVVAAAIGYEGSLSGLYDGLDAVVSGPDSAQVSASAETSASDPDPATASAGSAGGGRDGASGGSGGGTTPNSGSTVTGGGGGRAGSGTGDGTTGPVGEVLNGVDDTVNGLLGGGSGGQ